MKTWWKSLKFKFHIHRKRRLKRSNCELNRVIIFSHFLLLNIIITPVLGDWCYDGATCGPANWGGVCTSGSRQSPINIPTTKVVSKSQNTRIILNKNYASPKLFFIKNTGHTLQLSVNADDKSKCFLRGDGLGKDPYYFSQLHFHWGPNNLIGSEHMISGKAYPLEMHMVHKKLKDEGKIAVLGVLFYLAPNDNPSLNPILSLVDKVIEPNSIAKTGSNNKITLTTLFPKKMRMFRYAGSLTTPPCSESVTWTVFRDPLPVSKKQMAIFRKLMATDGKKMTSNFRPVQPAFTNSRKSIFFVRQLKTSEGTSDSHKYSDANNQNQWEPGHYHHTTGTADWHYHQDPDDLPDPHEEQHFFYKAADWVDLSQVTQYN